MSRYAQFGLQPGGVPPPAADRLQGTVAAEVLPTVSGALAEPARSPVGARPVCAIYFSNQMKGGDDKVLLADFETDWAERY